jgi:serine/threonine protein kinase
MKEIKLINSGTYGCVYHPGMSCEGKGESLKYITKIQKNKRAIENELHISNKIRKISGYTRFFAPVLKHCPVKIQKDTFDKLRKCDVFKDDGPEEAKSYVSTKIRYVGDLNLRKIAITKSALIPFLIKTHIYVLKGLEKLFGAGVVHYDIKNNNIMYDRRLDVPIIIDFGLSFSIDELNTAENFKKYFFVFEYYSWWPIDIVMCSFIAQEIGFGEMNYTLVSEEQLELVFKVFFYGKDNIDGDVLNDMFSSEMVNGPEKQRKFHESNKIYFERFIGKPWRELYDDLMTHANTWDNYSVASTILDILNELQKNTPGTAYVDVLEQIVYSTPDARPSLRHTIKLLSNIND